MSENLRLYAKLGVRGVQIQGNYVTPGSDLVVLKNYVWRRLMWNPALKTEDVTKEFCEGYFGPARDAMFAYVNALEASVREPELIHADEFAGPGYLKPEARKQLSDLRLKAIAAAEGKDPFLRRVKEGTVGIEVLALAEPGVLQERDEQLVPKSEPQNATERGRDALAHVRNSGSNEWTSGKGYWVNFISSLGGQVATLSEGDLAVKVTPLQGGRIRQITWRGKPLLYEPKDALEASYPLVGGATLGFGDTLMRFVGEPGKTRAAMEDVFQVPGWRFSMKGSTDVTVSVEPQDTVILSGSPKGNIRPKAGASASAEYVLDVDSATERVEYMTKDGTWQKPGWQKSDQKGKKDWDEFNLQDIKALRIGLRAKGCTVLDEYVTPEVKGATLLFNPKTKRLTTTVKTAVPVAKPREKAEVVRRIQVVPTEAKAK
jgi:hypothetical protein